MDTRNELETELVAQLQVASNSSLFPASRITTLIQNAYKKATNLFIWPDLVQAFTSSTKNGYEYYDFPDAIRSNTIVRLMIDDDPYGRKNFQDYQDYKEENSNTTKKMFAFYGRFFFVNPEPTADGSSNMDVWGAVQADALSASDSETIFTNSNPLGNEAVVQIAFSTAMKRIDKALAKEELKEALGILAKLNTDEWKATQSSLRLDHPAFNVPNYFGNSRNAGIGRFAYQT